MYSPVEDTLRFLARRATRLALTLLRSYERQVKLRKMDALNTSIIVPIVFCFSREAKSVAFWLSPSWSRLPFIKALQASPRIPSRQGQDGTRPRRNY